MAFDVQVADRVVDYLQRCDNLTIGDRDRILAGMVEELSANADRFLARNPHPLDPQLFWYDFVLATEARVVREFRFWCSAEGHVFGVTEVRYAEEFPLDDDGGD